MPQSLFADFMTFSIKFMAEKRSKTKLKKRTKQKGKWKARKKETQETNKEREHRQMER